MSGQDKGGPVNEAATTVTTEAIEAAAFRRLLAHLSERTDVQNLDLMNLAGFCRNCLAKWYRAAAEERGVTLSDAEARERVYGMPYPEWKARHQPSPTVALPGADKGHS
ncbi:MAG TPA: DUF1244 domain-containing protein [Myxococcota bacterium]|nr:DUF1244 domain-containing protein [Myxococcota bacterium]